MMFEFLFLGLNNQPLGRFEFDFQLYSVKFFIGRSWLTKTRKRFEPQGLLIKVRGAKQLKTASRAYVKRKGLALLEGQTLE